MANDDKSAAESGYSGRLSDLVGEPMKFLLPIEGYEQMPLVSLEEAVEPIREKVPNIDKMVYIAKANHKNCPTQLAADLSAAITVYTMESNTKMSLYFTLNSTLRCCTLEREENLKCWFLYLKLLITALSHLPSYHGIVYRGVKQDLSGSYTKGKDFVWWGFSSCTTSLSVLQSNLFFGDKGDGTLFIIDSFTGKDIRQYSHYAKEEEILLVTARSFIVIDCLNVGPGRWIIHIKETEPPFHFLKTDSSISSTFELTSNIDQPLSTMDASENTDYILMAHAETNTDSIVIAHTGVNTDLVTSSNAEANTDYTITANVETNTDDEANTAEKSTTHQKVWFDTPSERNTNETMSSAVELINSDTSTCPQVGSTVSRAEPQKPTLSSFLTSQMSSHSLSSGTESLSGSSVKILRLTNGAITDTMIDVLVNIVASNLQLETIYLVNNRLGDELMCHLIETIYDRSDLRFFIIDNQITNRGAASLADVLIRYPQVFQMLNLERNLIDDQGVISFMNALTQSPNSSLKSLSLSRNVCIGDGCIDSIIDTISDNHTLRSLYLEKCNLSDDGKQRLRNTIGKKSTFQLQL
ncbi:unnamed protein product [Adineta ricciae]|uniref:NAD(P)(+)--arginine ADP-ribosyltransferase n=1 Tax=Adineta ricciae TaxID=249248 RepID=A0A815G9I1_ADIRI|nr:unnamed protein product [Adineta ricciae]CAF1335536.1 unnamed protein product [Adineta ricciae]